MIRVFIFTALLLGGDQVYASSQKLITDKAMNCDFSNSLVINIFKSFVVIPNKYYIKALPSSENALILSKNNFIENHTGGYVEVGLYKGTQPDNIEKYKKQYSIKKETVQKSGSFNIVIYELANIPLAQIFLTFIYKDGEYIQIMDEHPYDWKSLLNSYEIFKDEKCPRY